MNDVQCGINVKAKIVIVGAQNNTYFCLLYVNKKNEPFLNLIIIFHQIKYKKMVIRQDSFPTGAPFLIII